MAYYMVETMDKDHYTKRTVLRAKNINNLRRNLIRDTSWDKLYKGNLSTKGYADGVITIYPVNGPNSYVMIKGRVPEDLFRTVDRNREATYWAVKYNGWDYAYKVSERTGNLSKTVKRRN